VRVYELDESTNSWDQRASLTMGQQRDSSGYFQYYFGHSLDMSDDGTVIAIRSAEQPTPPTGGQSATHIFRFDSSDPTRMAWRRSSSDIVDEGSLVTSAHLSHRTSLSLSGNGNYVAIGAPMTDVSSTDAGRVQVFKDPSTAAPSPASPASGG